MTLPLAFMIIGTAATTAPASMLMARVGRKIGFLFGSGLAVFASLLAALGVYQQSFAVFCLAAFLIGAYLAFLQQYRFAVAESVAPDAVPKSLSILMLSVLWRFLRPEVGRRFSSVDGLPDFVGSFLGLAVMMAMSFFILLLFFRDTEIQADTSAGMSVPPGVVLRQPTVILP